TSSINGEGRNAIASAASSAHASANEASTEATSAVSSRIQAQVNGLKSYLFQYYSVGLWSYCKATEGLEVVCSDPSTSFDFDFSAVLDSTPIKVRDVLPEIDRTAISGYRRFFRSVICLYISGFVTTTLAMVLGVRKTLFSRGHRLLAIFCMLSSLLITTATVVVTVMYGLFATGIKNSLQSLGVQVSLGAQMFGAAWLAVSFSIGALITWLIQLFCCCI
ncbi:hypothetical protein N7510_002689, partial [Penicillium lagena]|uniref:uncharacterized protein n=1 Tax=Penicillium lagena TaxID=94218 RepID=UPI0025407EAE